MVKKLLQGSKDPFLALLSYRTTPLPWCNFSPAELLMGRQLKTDVPQTKDHYIPQWPHLKNLKEDHQKYKMPRASITTNITVSELCQHFQQTQQYGSRMEVYKNQVTLFDLLQPPDHT